MLVVKYTDAYKITLLEFLETMLNKYLTTFGQKRMTVVLHVLIVLIAIQLVLYDTLFPSLSQQVSSQIEFVFSSSSKSVDPGWSKDTEFFYQDADYKPVWLEEGSISLNALNLLHILNNAEKEGLNTQDYLSSGFQRLQKKKNKSVVELAKLDIALTQSALKYIDHLSNGRLPEFLKRELWIENTERRNTREVLRSALNTDNLVPSLHGLIPTHHQYHRLRKKLADLKTEKASGGWPVLPNHRLIKPGDFDSRVQVLRQRLKQTGDLSLDSPDSKRFDKQLKTAVEKFQQRHGILVDGTVGKETIDVLNVSLEQRISQIVFNMERWRYVPPYLGDPYILVNASGFELVAVANETIKKFMRVIVGKTHFQTPLFSSRINRIVLNPEWHVPRSIAIGELIPKLIDNPNYLEENNFYVTRPDRSVVPYEELRGIDWSIFDENNLPMNFHQKAGEDNPLGMYKFVVPNSESIFLHDTNNRMLFNNLKRDLSHGCIRVEDPLGLTEFLLHADSQWTRKAIRESVETMDTRVIEIRRPVRTHIVNFTAWVDADGRVSFYDDIYNLDHRMKTYLGVK